MEIKRLVRNRSVRAAQGRAFGSPYIYDGARTGRVECTAIPSIAVVRMKTGTFEEVPMMLIDVSQLPAAPVQGDQLLSGSERMRVESWRRSPDGLQWQITMSGDPI